MGPFERESILALLYLLSACLSTVTITSTAKVWMYWDKSLDTCIDIRCGCILYASKAMNMLTGGYNYLCHFATFACVPVVVVSLLVASYHGYRSCMIQAKSNSLEALNRYRRRNGGDVLLVTLQQPEPVFDIHNSHWKLLVMVAGVITILLSANAAVLTDGFYTTCQQYRGELARSFATNLPTALVTSRRLSCEAIFNFMDYVDVKGDDNQPGDGKHNIPLEKIIDTAFYLIMSIISAWINLFIWISLIICNSLLAKSFSNYHVYDYISRVGN